MMFHGGISEKPLRAALVERLDPRLILDAEVT